MTPIKVAIVEEEIIFAKTIVLALETIGYEVVGTVGKYNEAIDMIAKNSPDIVLIDINLGTTKDGIDLALEIIKKFRISIIFINDNSNPITVNRAKAIKPLAFLVKPFSKHDLYSAIEIGWYNYKYHLNSAPYIVVKVGTTYEKVVINEIMFLKSEQNYMMLTLVSGRKILVRSVREEMLKNLPEATFIKISRSYIVNCKYITTIGTRTLSIANLKLNITKEVKEILLLKF